MPVPIKITITAFDGTANGLLKYTTSPANAELYLLSKALVQHKHMPKGYGAYILIGTMSDQPAIYVGMTRQLQRRLKEHATSPPDGIVWTQALAIAACDKHFLAGTGAEYLEADLYHKALDNSHYIIANRAPVDYPSCPDVDQYAYIRFLAEVYMLIKLAGFDIFEGVETDPDVPLHITFKEYKHKVRAIPEY